MRDPRRTVRRDMRRDLWWVTLLTLTAFALRLTDLTGRSLWLDESFTLLRINGTWAEMMANVVWRQGIYTVDLNPPLYFALLKVWAMALGASEFALKLFSASWSVIIVPLAWVLARRLFGHRAGLMAAALAVIGPAYQWYAAELRMYSMVACLGAASTYLAYRMVAVARHRAAMFGTWLAVSVAAIFTHYSFLSLAAAQIVFAVVTLAPRLRGLTRQRSFWISAGLALVVVVAAITVLGGPTLARGTQMANSALTSWVGRGASASGFTLEVLTAANFGLNAADPTGSALNVLIGALITLGIILPLDRSHLSARLLSALVVIVPMLFWIALSYRIENQPSFRYVVFIFPMLQALSARGMDVLLRGIGSPRPALRWASAASALLAVAVVFGASLHGLRMAFTRTPTFQDDWRRLGTYLRQNWQPGDVLIINLNTPEGLMPYVLQDLPMEVVPVEPLTRRGNGEVRDELRHAYRRIWYANTGGDGGYQNNIAQERFAPYLLSGRTPFPSRTTIIELLKYEVQPQVMDLLPASATPVAEVPAGVTGIAGYKIGPGNPYHSNANFTLSLYWRRGSDALGSQAVTTRLTNQVQLWLDWTLGARLGAHPAEWTEGKLYRRDYIVPVPPGLPIQPYQLELLVRAGDKSEVAQSIAQPLSDDALACCVRVKTSPGDVRWATSDVALAIAEFPDLIRPGEPLPIALTWQSKTANTRPWQTELKLEGLLGGEVASMQRDAGTQDSPPGAWPAGELARDVYSLQVPYTTQPGLYRLSLNRLQGGRFVDGTLLGLVRIEDYPLTPVSTNVQHPVNAKVGEMSLLGYSARGPFERGKTYDVITHWRADAQPQRDAKLFLHVLAADGRPVSQDDNAPFGGKRSTLTFRPGDGIDQVHRITLPADLPAGEYQLLAGIYNSDGGARWPAQQDGQPARDDLIRLGTFKLD